MVDIVYQYYSTYYSAPSCSKTFLFCFFLYFLIISVSFFMAFSKRNFWILESVDYEQASIRYLDQYMMVIQTTEQTYFFTNIPEIQSVRKTSPEIPTVTVYQIVDNQLLKELPQTQNITALISLTQSPSAIRFTQLILFFEYRLTGMVPLIMQSFGEISIISKAGLQNAYVMGSIELQQTHPLQAGRGNARDIYNYPAFYDSNGDLLVDQIQIVQANQYRNETINIQYKSLVQSAIIGDTLSKLEITLQIPRNQEIIYIPSLLETLKMAWIQYLSTLILLMYLGSQLLSLLIEKKVFNTKVENDLPQGAVSYSKQKLE